MQTNIHNMPKEKTMYDTNINQVSIVAKASFPYQKINRLKKDKELPI